MRNLTNEIKVEIKELVFGYLAEECELDISDIQDDKNVVDDLDGDSLMFVGVVELLRKKYDLSIEMQSIAQYLLRNPAKTVRDVVDVCCLVYEKENDIIDA